MPFKQVIVLRWQVIAAFLILAGVSVFLVAWESRVSNRAREAAQDAKVLARENTRRINEIQQLRRARISEVARADERLCQTQNQTHDRIVAFIVAASNPKTLIRQNAYYRQHPDELPNLAQVRARARAAFPHISCRKLPTHKSVPKKQQ